MSDLPDNWLEKIFDLMGQFYGERWSKQFASPMEIDLYKTMWFNGLNGLTYEQLRHGLAVSKKYSLFSYSKPPTVVKFFHFCIGLNAIDVPHRTSNVHK